MKAAAAVRRAVRTPRLVLGLLLAGQGLLLRLIAAAYESTDGGVLLPSLFVRRALILGSWVFLIAAAAAVLEASEERPRGGTWRSVGTLVLGLASGADIMAGACLAHARPAAGFLLRVFGVSLAASGVAMASVALKETRVQSERIVSLAGFLFNALVFVMGVGSAFWLKEAW